MVSTKHPQLYFGIDENDMTLEIGGKNFELDEGLIQKIVENIKKNCGLGYCKNCTEVMIVNSSTHKICWRCRERDATIAGGSIND